MSKLKDSLDFFAVIEKQLKNGDVYITTAFIEVYKF